MRDKDQEEGTSFLRPQQRGCRYWDSPSLPCVHNGDPTANGQKTTVVV